MTRDLCTGLLLGFVVAVFGSLAAYDAGYFNGLDRGFKDGRTIGAWSGSPAMLTIPANLIAEDGPDGQ
jgi:hypothetical protein